MRYYTVLGLRARGALHVAGVVPGKHFPIDDSSDGERWYAHVYAADAVEAETFAVEDVR